MMKIDHATIRQLIEVLLEIEQSKGNEYLSCHGFNSVDVRTDQYGVMLVGYSAPNLDKEHGQEGRMMAR